MAERSWSELPGPCTNFIPNSNCAIPRANNMFVEHRVPVRAHLKEGINELAIHFPSAYLRGLELEAKNGKKHVWNGNSSRLHVRKAQYQCVESTFSSASGADPYCAATAGIGYDSPLIYLEANSS